MAIAAIAGEWTASVARWKVLNARHVVTEGNFRAPSATFEYMLYQTLLGAWQPEDGAFPERLQAYALKAAREGKEETSWLNPHVRYEDGIATFIVRILDRSTSAEFLESFDAIARRISLLGALNSISQITLKATLPGVPDFYQGTELWDFSMVDPDNRRPVDYALRASTLATIAHPDWQSLAARWSDGNLKLAWTSELLRLRQKYPDLFAKGEYVPLEVRGRDSDHVIAFARRYGGRMAVVAVGRHFKRCTDGGRVWPQPESFQAEVDLGPCGLTADGLPRDQLRIAALFRNLPAKILVM